jgi:hypothetical protein
MAAFVITASSYVACPHVSGDGGRIAEYALNARLSVRVMANAHDPVSIGR